MSINLRNKMKLSFIFIIFILFFSCHQELSNLNIIYNSIIFTMGSNFNNTYGNKFIIDSENNIVISGTTDGTIYGSIQIGMLDIFIVKHNSNLDPFPINFTRIPSNSNSTVVKSMEKDSKGNIFIAGFSQGNVNFQNKIGIQDIFIIKLDYNLNLIYTKIIGTENGILSLSDFKIDKYDNIYITGNTLNSINNEPLKGTQDGFLIKMNNNGKVLWTKLFGVSNSETTANALAIDQNNFIYITGSTKGNLNNKIKKGKEDCFILKYDEYGNLIFTVLNGEYDKVTRGEDIAVDNKGNIYISGTTNGNLNGNLKKGDIDLFLSKYNDNGTRIFTVLLGGESNILSSSKIAISKLGYIFVTGSSVGKIQTSLKSLSLIGNKDVFIAIYYPSGNLINVISKGKTGTSLEVSHTDFNIYDSFFILGNTDNGIDNFPKIGNVDFFITNDFKFK